VIDFRYKQHFKAPSGDNGRGDNQTGVGGADEIIKVPAGTQILDEDKETVLVDLTKPGDSMVFLKGGDGGFGNAHYKSSTNQAPRKTLPGWPGQEMSVWLRLKLIADVGLVGLPNAGKSTFLAATSNAKPKIADYPFTTLQPNLGVVKAGEYDFVIADIPGLIEGAHEGKGLGQRFLGHVERTAVLLHLVDVTEDNIVDNYKTIRGELEKYGWGLVDKDEIIAVNKCDTLGEELSADQAKELEEYTGQKVHLISGVSGEGVRSVMFALADYVKAHKAKEREEERMLDEGDDYKSGNEYDPAE
jgi:GTP-binding protein